MNEHLHYLQQQQWILLLIIPAIFIGTLIFFMRYPVRGVVHIKENQPQAPDATEKPVWPWNTAAIVVGGMLLMWSSYKAVSISSLSNFGQNHWPQLIILACILQTLIIINTKFLGDFAKTAKWIPTGILVAILIAIPIIGAATKDTRDKQMQKQMNTRVVAAYSKIMVPSKPGHRTVIDGDKDLKYVTVYRDGRLCPSTESCPAGALLGTNVENGGGKEITITVTYTR